MQDTDPLWQNWYSMTLIGPLDWNAQGHCFVFVLLNYATWYPKSVALRNISARSVAKALFRIIYWVRIPKEILTDWGMFFMLHKFLNSLRIGLKSLLFAIWEVLQASMVVLPILTIVRISKTLSILDIITENLEKEPSKS